MIGFLDQFKPNEIWELVAYVQSLSEEKAKKRKSEKAEKAAKAGE